MFNEKLQKIGLQTIEKGKEKYNQPRLENTHKRAQQAQYARKDALKEILIGELCVAVGQSSAYDGIIKTKKAVVDMYDKVLSARYRQKRDTKQGDYDLKDCNEETFDYFLEEDKTEINKLFLDLLMSVVNKTTPDATKIKIKELETKVDLGRIEGYFPTPRELADEMVSRLGQFNDTDIVLEPSAGKGSLIEAIKAQYPFVTVYCVEQNYSLCEILKLKSLQDELYHDDFLDIDFSVEDPITYFTKIIMNPPFENKQDIDHITHAIKFLQDGGKLVALASAGVLTNSDKKSVQFREMIDELGGTIELAPQGSFKKADRSTGVSVTIIEVSK